MNRSKPSKAGEWRTSCDHRRSFLPWVLIVSGLIVSAWVADLGMPTAASQLLAAQDASAQPQPKPKVKDNLAQFRPKQVAFTTSVTPAEAAPGETVTFTVKGTIQKGWHLYGYAEKQPEDGPRSTEFDFFGLGGAEIAGKWTPDRAPHKAKEPAFPDLEFVEFYENDVTWSIPIKIPADAAPGKRELWIQAYYQLCDAQSCTRPGRWTLPPTTLTIKAKGKENPAAASAPAKKSDAEITPAAAAAPAAAVAEPPQAGAGSGPSPAKKDNLERFRPKQVAWTVTAEPAKVRPGDKVRLLVHAKIEEGWHLYQIGENDAAGPHTEFDLFDAGGLKAVGKWASTTEPTREIDPNFPDLPFVDSFENEVTWAIILEVPADAPAGTKSLRVQAYYQLCDAMQCTRPGRWTLPAVALTVDPAAPAVPVATAPTAPAPTAPAAAAAPVSTPAAAVNAPKAAETAAASASVAESSSGGEAPVQNEVERALQRGIWPFLMLALGGGLLALAMPCVWPMIPVTVNFFVKQSQLEHGRPVRLAIVYCLSIIGIFTFIGVMFAIMFGAASLKNLANNPWLNSAIAIMFFVFGLSLLGLFEIEMPNFLINASIQGESRGGLIGVMFMAGTLTITSFTCTLPVVGGLILIATQGSLFYPILGMVVFSSVIALPFFLLALSPGLLKKMPKSGDWMNTVKIVGGLIEIGAAFKFVNTVELAFVTPENAWFDAQVLLAIWVVLAIVCGIYLLGLFRTDHDHDEVKVGPGRLLIGTTFLCIGLYLAPALFGMPPRGNVYNLVVGLLPPDSAELERRGGESVTVTATNAAGEVLRAKKAVSNVPEIAETEQFTVHGVLWGMSFEAGLKKAREDQRLILIDFTGVNCANCRLMESTVFQEKAVREEMSKFVTVQLYTDYVPIETLSRTQRQALGDKNFELLNKLANDSTNPFYVVVDPFTGLARGVLGGARPTETFMKFLKDAQSGWNPKSAAVARVSTE